jgi:hypothetical protein
MVAMKVGWARAQGGTVKPKTILGYAAIAFILFFVIKDPTGAVHVVTNIGNFLSSLARGFSAFFTSL